MSYPQAMTRREQAIAAQGARCGHIDGKARAGSYVIGEELLASDEAAANMRGDYRDTREPNYARWGYELGYVIGAMGEPLPNTYRCRELPDHCDDVRPSVLLSSGRTVRHRPMPSGAIEAYVWSDGPDEMTSDEWNEYAEIVKARAAGDTTR